MNILEKTKIKIAKIEEKILNFDNFNIACNLICRNKNNEIFKTKEYDLQEITNIGCESIRKDLNNIVSY